MSSSDFRSSKEAFCAYLIALSDAYYNTSEPLVEDNVFDALVHEYEQTYNETFDYLGSTNVHHAKARLPVFMSSLTKCKDGPAMLRFSQADPRCNTYVLSEKLDGISLLVHYAANAKQAKLYTRGDGTYGSDVSHLLPFIKLPTVQPKATMMVRGELVINKDIQEFGANLRNIVCGAVNAKTPNPDLLKHVEFVAYNMYTGEHLQPLEQLQRLEKLGFNVVSHSLLKTDQLTHKHVDDALTFYKASTRYLIDGLVVCKNVYVEITSDENPKHMIAYKRIGEVRQTEVLDVVWQLSRYNTLHPRVQIRPVVIDGCSINYVSGINAKYIDENKIGPGTLVEVQRSGDVIPNIISVVRPTVALLPPNIEWKGVHIVQAQDSNTREQTIARLTYAFKTLNAKGISEGTIRKLVEAGYTTEVQLWNANEEDIAKIDGFKERSANLVVTSLRASHNNLDLTKLLLISTCFEKFGEKKLEKVRSVLDIHAYLMQTQDLNDEEVYRRLNGAGFRSMAVNFIECCKVFRSKPYYMQLLQSLRVSQRSSSTPSEPASSNQDQRVVVCTGFRPSQVLVAEGLKKQFNFTGSSVTRTTFCVVTVNINHFTSKIRDAKKNNIPVFDLRDFLQKYELKM